MGKLKMGILSGFTGAVGTVVGSTSKKGNDIIKARVRTRSAAASAEQLKQQSKFGMTTGFMKGLNPVLKIGMKQRAVELKTHAFSYATQQALMNAVSGSDDNPMLDYAKISLSEGVISRLKVATATREGDVVNFAWGSQKGNSQSADTDKAMLVVYNVNQRELSFSEGEYVRTDLAGTVDLPYTESGDTLLFYLFFQSAINPLMVSSSQYLGSAIVE